MSEFSINQYHNEVEKIIHFGGTKKETAIRTAFYNLLNEYAKSKGLMIVPEVTIKAINGKNVTPDGTLKDMLRQDWGYWESKDESDNIDEEIQKKFAKGYPKDNILFEDSRTAILIQNGAEVQRVTMKDSEALHRILTNFISFERPEVQNFRKAIELFRQDIPKVTESLRGIIITQEDTNPDFTKAAAQFLKLCHDSINPEITQDDVREMIIQHILTEDVFNTIFDENQFHRENNIARELEKVIQTFFTGQTRRIAIGSIQHYYQAINAAAAGIADHHEKQKFLKVIYETFYKSYNPKAADRLGVVYTPNEIVQFMIRGTDYLLHKHFNKFLEDRGVDILDPATGTGTFVCDMIDYMSKDKLQYKYKHEIHANEVAILPYYISNLNIEYTYTQKMGQYVEFENLCFVDTLDNMGFAYRGKQIDMFSPFTEENSKRIKKQNDRKIAVIIGNPPYNAKQENYNFQNSNRAYEKIDKRIKDTFIKYGTAQNQIVVYDMYTRFYRWAFDRLDNNGIIAFVTNRSFIDSRAFDGFRKIVLDEFDFAYVIDTKSDVRANPKISGTTHNVFGIQTGVAIMFLVRKFSKVKKVPCAIYYATMQDQWKKEEKLQWLAEHPLQNISFSKIAPDKNNNWINLTDNDFESLIPLIDKDVKSGKSKKALFLKFSRGVASQRDEWVYDFSRENLEEKVKFMLNVYSKTLNNVGYEDKFSIKWDRELDKYLEKGIRKEYSELQIHQNLYRPFSIKNFYFDKHLNGMTYQWLNFYKCRGENRFISFNGMGMDRPFGCIAFDGILDVQLMPNGQCVPFYYYDSKGRKNENLTDWGLNRFIEKYGKKGVDKETIFYYIYSVLHSPSYRKKYEQNLKREFPRIPFYSNFHQWASWGDSLMNLHIKFETIQPFSLERIETVYELDNPELFEKLGKAKLNADRTRGVVEIDGFTTLMGVPIEAWDYKIGNRSALEWVLSQYKESKPKDPTIAEKFNKYKFSEYKEQVIELLGKVCTVSIETMKIINEMKNVSVD